MEKNFLQDVIPPAEKKSIRNIPIPQGRRRTESSQRTHEPIRHEEIQEEDVEQTPPPVPPKSIHTFSKKKNGKKIKSIAILGLLIVAIIFILTKFSGAEVIVYPRTTTDDLNVTVQAQASEDADLQYATLSVSGTERLEVTATGEKEVEEVASGTITVFNEYSESPQTLVAKTRFESPNGYIYRIKEGVSVPGKKGNTPGSLEVVVYADEAGADYNTGIVDFTIPGFKGSEQFDTFYARAKTPISGGFVGTQKVVSEEDLKSAEVTLSATLMESLKAMVDEQVTDDFIQFTDKNLFTTSLLPQEESGNPDTVLLVMEGSLEAYVLDKESISTAVAKEVLSDVEIDDIVLITNFNDLSVTITPSTEDTSIDLELSGNASFEWQFDEDQLIDELTGVERDVVKTILQRYSAINRANIVLKPFWKNKFPIKEDKITITKKVGSSQ